MCRLYRQYCNRHLLYIYHTTFEIYGQFDGNQLYLDGGHISAQLFNRNYEQIDLLFLL